MCFEFERETRGVLEHGALDLLSCGVITANGSADYDGAEGVGVSRVQVPLI